MISKNIIIALVLTFAFSVSSFAQEVNVVLKNSKVIVGRVVEEKPDYVLIEYDLGQLKIYRQNIESITYNPFVKMGTADGMDKSKITDTIFPKRL